LEPKVTMRDRARFVPPAPPAAAVPLQRLDSHYEAATGRVLRVLAPGGYGKSTQTARWVAGEPRAVGWVDLERVDNDPYVLGPALTRALPGEALLPDEGSWRDAQGEREFISTVVPEFGARIRTCPTPFVLVLDDVHCVEAEPSLALVDALAENLPGTSTLVLSGRAHHGESSIARLRLHPGVIDVTVDDLALDVTETDVMLRAMGFAPEPDHLTALGDRFEGWPAGLRLAALSLRSGNLSSWASSDRAGDPSYVVDYLRAEWTGQLDAERLRFLREVACLERCTGEMCDTVLGRTGSAALLRRLHRDELLLLPLDQRDEWFKMHPLLARWLSSDLKEADPTRWRDLHLRAAHWWAVQGDIDLAFDHAMLAGDLEGSEVLVGAHGPTYLSRAMYTTVRRWLASFPAEYIRDSASLCAVGAYDGLHLGDGARAMQWYGRLSRIVGPYQDDDIPTDPPTLWACSLRTTLEARPARELIAVGEHACRHLQGGPYHGAAHLALGGQQFLACDPRAGENFAAGALEAELAGSTLLAANCIAAGAVLAELRGDRRRATEDGRRAQAILVENRSEHVPTTAVVTAMHALIQAREGRRDRAAKALDLARRKVRGFGGVGPWYNVLARLPLVRTALLIDDRVAARTLIREIDLALVHEPEENGATAELTALRASVEQAAHRSPDPSVSLTSAELRVLRHLPTNLSLGDIATRLFLSRNTVKTHAGAIYRKLGTTSRGEAVELAQQAGLLGDQPLDLRAKDG
jgi:LuxR family maltose regulon positive regulatory protein